MKFIALISALLIFLPLLVKGQDLPAHTDSLENGIITAQDTTTTPPFVRTKSPLTAALLSAALPGLGQFYNESYWKIPVVFGIAGYFVYNIVVNQRDFASYRDRYASTITETNPSGDLRLKQLREFYRDQRDTYIWWLGIFYILQVADAVVDAHLYDFDVSDTVTANIRFQPLGGITLSIRF